MTASGMSDWPLDVPFRGTTESPEQAAQLHRHLKEDSAQIAGWATRIQDGSVTPYCWLFPDEAPEVQALIDFREQFGGERYRYWWRALVPQSPELPGIA